MNIEFRFDSNKPSEPLSRDEARHLLIVGPFSGDKPAGDEPAALPTISNMFTADPLEVDAIVARLEPHASVHIGDEDVPLVFRDSEDFHPDRLMKAVPAFRKLLELRSTLLDPAQYPAAAALASEILGLDADTARETPTEAGPETSDDMFTRLLGQPSGSAGKTSPAVKSAMDKLLADAVGSETSPTPDSSVDTLTAALDGMIRDAMRELLRDPQFRAVETSWRSLMWFGEHLEDDEDLSVWIVDADVSRMDALLEELPRRVTSGPGSVDQIVVLREFSDSDDDLEQLRHLATLASSLNASAFAGAGEALAGLKQDHRGHLGLDGSDFDTTMSDAYNATRAASSSVCLGFPGFILRQPYGRRSDPVDTIPFEELETPPANDAFLWGNAGLPLAVMALEDQLLLGDFPMVVYDEPGGQAIMPPTGVFLADSAADAILSRGIVPLMAHRGDTSVRVPRLQSLAITPV